MLNKAKIKVLLLLVLIVTGMILSLLGWLDVSELFSQLREYDDQLWLMAILVVVQVILFTFALAGSSLLWLIALLYQPLLASFILATGATLGGLSAYYFSQRLSEQWLAKIQSAKAYQLLQINTNFIFLLSLRLFPAFPHALINYSAGILKVNLLSFLTAAFIGIAVKSFIYAQVIHNASRVSSYKELLNFEVLAPLLFLSIFFLLAFITRLYLSSRNK